MISILIPVHNYLIEPLIKSLLQQLKNHEINWEILISDDASNSYFKTQNHQFISALNVKNIQLFYQKENIGNAANRNLLGSKAKNEWLLFLDADMLPVYNNFIQLYLKRIKVTTNSIISGNVIYEDRPENRHLLRWKYGNEKEELALHQRAQNPKLTSRGANFAIKKDVFLQNQFPLLKEKYGFVDTRFFLQFEENQFDLIENPTFHLGLDSNNNYLEKTKKAVANALFLLNSNDKISNKIKLVLFYKRIRILRKLLSFLYTIFGNYLQKKLASNTPSIQMLQVFKLLYIAKLDVVKNS